MKKDSYAARLWQNVKRHKGLYLMILPIVAYYLVFCYYLDEFKLKFILGTEPLENFPEFVENIRNMNIERAIEIRQAEYDRYLAR